MNVSNQMLMYLAISLCLAEKGVIFIAKGIVQVPRTLTTL